MTLITLETFYWLIGAIFLFLATQTALDRSHPKRWGTALFWGLLAVVSLFGKLLPPAAVGYLVLALVALAALNQVAKSAERSTTRAERAASAGRLKNRLFWPALLVPVCAIAGTFLLGRIHAGDLWLAEPKQATLIALGLGALVATLVARRLTGDRWQAPLHEGSRLLQAIGWALILPQLLAALGGIFAQAGVGAVIADLVAHSLPMRFPFVAVLAYAVGMALFTMCLGNAFAAFPVITLGVGLPFIVGLHHGNPAIMAAIGMLSGYCGTLMTPMAANFNLVPAMLLELNDRNAVVKAQVPIGLAILSANILILYFAVFRF